MARKYCKDRGILFKRKKRKNKKTGEVTEEKGKWWVRIFPNGREKWYPCATKSQAKALYGRLKAEMREGTYFPEKYSPKKTLPRGPISREFLKRERIATA
jgi:hypothetical protein